MLERIHANSRGDTEWDFLQGKLHAEKRGILGFFVKDMELTPEEAQAKISAPLAETRCAMLASGPATEVRWRDLVQLVYSGQGEEAKRRWQHLLQITEDEFICGDKAASILEATGEAPAERARFLTIRRRLIDEWNPSPGTEEILVDQIAQFQTLFERWIRVHVEKMSAGDPFEAQVGTDRGRHLGQFYATVGGLEAMQEALNMADRLQKAMLRTIRALKDLRKSSQQVVIQSAGQVNLGSQQVNLSGS
jgi:hypothetical protein